MATATVKATTVGVFATREAAERAVTDLKKSGYRDDQIGVVGKDASGKTVKADGAGHTNAGEGAAQIQSIIARVQNGFTAVGQEIDGVARAATSNLSHCDRVIDELGNLAKGVDLSSTDPGCVKTLCVL